MDRQLNVDTSRLQKGADALRGVAFPEPPPAITVGGTDAVSAAINETMLVIESPVFEGMPVAKAALAKTASSLATAAEMYAETDHYLGRPLAQHEFTTAGDLAASRAVTARTKRHASSASAEPTDTAPSPFVGLDSFEEIPRTVTVMTPPLNQMVNTVGSFSQSFVSSAQGATQGQRFTDRADEEAEETDTEVQLRTDHVPGAASESQGLERVPTETTVATSARHSSSDRNSP